MPVSSPSCVTTLATGVCLSCMKEYQADDTSTHAKFVAIHHSIASVPTPLPLNFALFATWHVLRNELHTACDAYPDPQIVMTLSLCACTRAPVCLSEPATQALHTRASSSSVHQADLCIATMRGLPAAWGTHGVAKPLLNAGLRCQSSKQRHRVHSPTSQLLRGAQASI